MRSIFLRDAIVSLILSSHDFGAVIQIFGKPALSSDLDSCVLTTIPGIPQVVAAHENRGWKIENRDGFRGCAEKDVCVAVGDGFCSNASQGRVKITCTRVYSRTGIDSSQWNPAFEFYGFGIYCCDSIKASTEINNRSKVSVHDDLCGTAWTACNTRQVGGHNAPNTVIGYWVVGIGVGIASHS